MSQCLGGWSAWRRLRASPCFRLWLRPGQRLAALLLRNGTSRLGQGQEEAGLGGSVPPSGPPQDELNYLRDYTQGLEEALNATKMRMAELETAQKGE